jgi:hypothetical protein
MEPGGATESRWSAGRIAGLVLSSLLGLIGLALLLGGLALIFAEVVLRGDDGFIDSGAEPLRSTGYAITTEEIDLGADPVDWAPEELLGTIRVRADQSAKPIFLGIGPEVVVERYLRGVRHDELTDFEDGDPVYAREPGNASPRPPGRERFWVARAEGRGEQALEWEAESGIWAVVLMNADGSRGVAAEAEVGANVDWLGWVGGVLAIVGLLVSAGAVLLVVMIARHAARSGTGTS